MSGVDFGGRLRDLRHARGETLEAVSAATGLSVAMLSRVERGERLPSPESVEALAAHFELPAEELMSETIAYRLYSRYGAVTSRHAAEKMRSEEPVAWEMDAGALSPEPGAGVARSGVVADSATWRDMGSARGVADSLTSGVAEVRHAAEEGPATHVADMRTRGAQSAGARPAPPAAAPLPTRVAGTAFSAQPIEALFGGEAARDQLADAARVAEVALESAMRAVRRARASGDPQQAEEAERVVERLREALG